MVPYQIVGVSIKFIDHTIYIYLSENLLFYNMHKESYH